jgi:hypothetical protein
MIARCLLLPGFWTSVELDGRQLHPIISGGLRSSQRVTPRLGPRKTSATWIEKSGVLAKALDA